MKNMITHTYTYTHTQRIYKTLSKFEFNGIRNMIKGDI